MQIVECRKQKAERTANGFEARSLDPGAPGLGMTERAGALDSEKAEG